MLSHRVTCLNKQLVIVSLAHQVTGCVLVGSGPWVCVSTKVSIILVGWYFNACGALALWGLTFSTV